MRKEKTVNEYEKQEAKTWVAVAQQEGNLPAKLRVPGSNPSQGWIRPGRGTAGIAAPWASAYLLQPDGSLTLKQLVF